MRPEWALAGTVTSRRVPAARSRAAGEVRLMWAPGARGKATSMPDLSPTPDRTRVPCEDTWWGFPLQRDAGAHLTLVILTVVTCSDAAPTIVAPLLAGADGADTAWVPPALAAVTGAGAQAARPPSTSAAPVTPRNVNRLWAHVLAKTTK